MDYYHFRFFNVTVNDLTLFVGLNYVVSKDYQNGGRVIFVIVYLLDTAVVCVIIVSGQRNAATSPTGNEMVEIRKLTHET